MRHINIVVPSLLDKVDRLVAGMIAMAVLTPFLGVTWRYIEVNRLLLNGDSGRYGQNRVRINQLRSGIIIAQINLTINRANQY